MNSNYYQFASNSTETSSDGESQSDSLEFYVIFLCLLVFFFIMAGVIEKYKPPFGHETGMTVVLGIILSVIIYASIGAKNADDWKFSEAIFFDFFLPPIIFNSGFNMRRKKFFMNIGNITIFGLVVTLFCFFVYSGLTIGLFRWFDFNYIDYYNNDQTEKFFLDDIKVMLVCALLCSSDVVAAVSIVSYSEQPKLYSCVFGEGVFNDIVSIILFSTVNQFQKPTFEFTGTTPLLILGGFIGLAVFSLALGCAMGFFTSLVFKYARFLTVNAITETFLIFCFSLLTYYIGDLCHLSGIIALLSCGIVQAHYTWYNLSPQGKTSSSVTIGFLGAACEAAVYSYIGIALYSLIPTKWCWPFIWLEFIIIVIGRLCCVIGVFYLFRLCFRAKTIAFNELCFITYAGMIRGAIAFALVLKIDESTFGDDEKAVVVTATLAIVMITTLLFGTFMSLVQRKLVPPTVRSRTEYSHLGSNIGRMPSQFQQDQQKQEEKAHTKSEYHEIVHPNDENLSRNISIIVPRDPNQPPVFAQRDFVQWFIKFDDQKLRPLFIRNYSREKAELEDQYFEALKENFDVEKPEDIKERLNSVFEMTRNASYVPTNMPRAQTAFVNYGAKGAQNRDYIYDKLASSNNHITEVDEEGTSNTKTVKISTSNDDLANLNQPLMDVSPTFRERTSTMAPSNNKSKNHLTTGTDLNSSVAEADEEDGDEDPNKLVVDGEKAE